MARVRNVARRAFLQGMAGAAAAGSLSSRAADAPAAPAPAAAPSVDRAWMSASVQGLYRVEMDIRDCEVEGKLPTDLSGAFYRVGPDPQYPMRKGNIPFDGEGHVSLFRIHDGQVDYRSRFVRNERYVARRRNAVCCFRSTATRTWMIPPRRGSAAARPTPHHPSRDMMLALKEDSPPTAMDLLTPSEGGELHFDGTLPSKTFTVTRNAIHAPATWSHSV